MSLKVKGRWGLLLPSCLLITLALMTTGAFGLNVGNWAVIDTSLTLDSVQYCTISFSKFRHCPVSTVLCHVGGRALCVEVSTGLLACWHEWHGYHFLSSIEYGNLIGHTQCQIWCLHFVQSIKVSENWQRVCWFSLSGDMHSCHWTGNDTLLICCWAHCIVKPIALLSPLRC